MPFWIFYTIPWQLALSNRFKIQIHLFVGLTSFSNGLITTLQQISVSDETLTQQCSTPRIPVITDSPICFFLPSIRNSFVLLFCKIACFSSSCLLPLSQLTQCLVDLKRWIKWSDSNDRAIPVIFWFKFCAFVFLRQPRVC